MTDVLPRRSKVAATLHAGSGLFGDAQAAVIRRTFLLTARRFRSRLLHLVDDLAGGNISLSEFTRRSNRVLRDGLGISYSLGALSVDPFHTLTLRDVRNINAEIDEERSFLRAFGRDLQRGFYVLDPIQRAGLYLRALRGMFEFGRVEASPPGPYDWDLGLSEHCIECIRASLDGPYQRDRFSGLGLPALPGIPGSGDVCRGLTSCGCTVRMSSGLPLPNEALQQEIRELLVEVLHGTEDG